MDLIPTEKKGMGIPVCAMVGCMNCVQPGSNMAASTHQGPTGVISQDSLDDEVPQPLREPGSVGGSSLPEFPSG